MSSAFIELPGSAAPLIVKDPDANLDYRVAWKDWLAGDTLASVAWDVPAGLTGSNQSINTGGSVTIDGVVHPVNTVATIWLAGGTLGATYTVRCRATSASSPARVDDRSFRVRIGNK